MGMRSMLGDALISKIKAGLLVSGVVLFSGLSNVSVAETLYRWVDKAGRVHYGDKANKQAETIEIKVPVRQSNSEEDQQQQQVNQAWFEQERQRRAKEAAGTKKLQTKQQKKWEKRQLACNKAEDKYDRARAELKARKRAGVTPKLESKLKLRLESLEYKVEQSC